MSVEQSHLSLAASDVIRALAQEASRKNRDLMARVIPAFTQGDHTLAKLISQSDFFGFVPDTNDLLQAVGGAKEDIFSIRLFSYKEDPELKGLQLLLELAGFNRELFFSWQGGAVDQEEPRLYGNIVDDTDFAFLLGQDPQQYGINAVGGGKFEKASQLFVGSGKMHVFNNIGYTTPKGCVIDTMGLNNGIARVVIKNPSGKEFDIQLPAEIPQINLAPLVSLNR